MTALLLSGYLSVLHHCVDFDCRLLKRFKKQPCEISIQDGTAYAFGSSYPIKQSVYGSTEIYGGWSGNLYMSLHFRPRGKIIRVYISEYADKRTYKRWTCNFHREGESDW